MFQYASPRNKDIFPHSPNAIMTSNKIYSNSLISFNTQFLFNFSNCFQICLFPSVLFKLGVKKIGVKRPSLHVVMFLTSL